MNKLIYYPCPRKENWSPIYKILPLTDIEINTFRYYEDMLLTNNKVWELFSKGI